MTYSNFTLRKVKEDFNIITVEDRQCFDDIKERDVSSYLLETLDRNVPLALAINTEKARSEPIIINILLEVKQQLAKKISLFSGIDFTMDKEMGLTGYCDYIISQSPEQLYLDTPVVSIVEAKNENIVSGIGQCIAEMYAAQLFNRSAKHPLPATYGAITTRDEWRFIKLVDLVAYIDRSSYYISEINKIVAILVYMASADE